MNFTPAQSPAIDNQRSAIEAEFCTTVRILCIHSEAAAAALLNCWCKGESVYQRCFESISKQQLLQLLQLILASAATLFCRSLERKLSSDDSCCLAGVKETQHQHPCQRTHLSTCLIQRRSYSWRLLSSLPPLAISTLQWCLQQQQQQTQQILLHKPCVPALAQ